MKNFVLYSSTEEPHDISEEEFEKSTKSKFPFKQKFDGKNHYYATCPECENPIQIRGLYTSDRQYGAHTGKNINGLNEFNYLNYIYCPRAVQGRRVPKDERKPIEALSPKDIAVYNTVRNNFDLAVDFAKKHMGYYISDDKARECLETYYASQGWLYPHSTVNNIPFMLFYLQPALNPYGLFVRKGSVLEKAILKTNDLRLVPIDGRVGTYYNKLLPNSRQYMALTMMLWKHQFKEDESSSLKESINIEICKDISDTFEVPQWDPLVNAKINIPELEFVKFVNYRTAHRNENLQNFALQLMPPL